MSAPRRTGGPGRWIAICASVVVAGAVVAAIAVMGPPSRQRLLRLDERRVADLDAITAAVIAYRNEHGRLPPSLAAIAAQPGVRIPADPETRHGYEYEVVGKDAYRLCARFDTDTADTAEVQPWMLAAWAHGTGRQCFRRRTGNVRE